MDKPIVRTEPHDLVALRATVGLRFGLTLTAGQAYDQHLNMILGDVEETITQVLAGRPRYSSSNDDETHPPGKVGHTYTN